MEGERIFLSVSGRVNFVTHVGLFFLCYKGVLFDVVRCTSVTQFNTAGHIASTPFLNRHFTPLKSSIMLDIKVM